MGGMNGRGGMNNTNNPNGYNGYNQPGAATPMGSTVTGAATPATTTPTTTRLTFHDVAVNDNFYFTTDTNRTYKWTKTTDNKAKNTVNGNEATIASTVPVKQ
jgi:hypothetical protein